MSMLNRREIIIGGALGSLALLWGRLPTWAQISSGAEELRGGVSIFKGAGGTIGFYVGEGGAAIVDSQFPQTAQKCVEAIQESFTEVADALINTHHHADHTGGNGVFEPHVHRIIAHKNVPALQKQQAKQRRKLHGEPVYANLTFEKSMRMEVAKEVINMTHHGNAHTSGDIVVHFEKANVVHMGDLVFNRLHPYIDAGAGASVENWIQVLQAVIDKFDDETKFIFGHGAPEFGVVGTKEDILVQQGYLKALWKVATTAVKEGKSKEEAQKLIDLPGYLRHQSRGKTLSLENCIAVAYDEASK